MKFIDTPLLTLVGILGGTVTVATGFVLNSPLHKNGPSTVTARRASRTEDYLIDAATSHEFQLAPPVLANPDSGDLYPLDEELQFKRIDLSLIHI